MSTDHVGQKCWMSLPQGRLEIANYSFKHGRERISPEYLEEASRCILGAVDFKPPEA